MTFGIIYLVYNFLRSLAIIMEICFKKEETFNNRNLIKNILHDLNEKEDISDIHSEKESIKKSHEENNEDNIDNEIIIKIKKLMLNNMMMMGEKLK